MAVPLESSMMGSHREQGIFRIWEAALRHLRARWRTMLAINVGYAALGFVLLAPLTGLAVRLLLRLSGARALADQDILHFLLTPLGVASLILIAGMILAIAVLAQASMMFAGRRAPAGGPTAVDAIAFAFARAVPILAFSTRLVARILLIAAPFLLVAAATAWVLTSAHDINYYLAQRPPVFWLAGTIVALLGLAMLAAVVVKLIGWAVALPLLLFASTPPGRSFAESERLTRGRRLLVLRVLAVWTLGALALGALAAVIVQVLGAWIAPRFHEDLTLLAVVLGGLVALWALLSFLVASFNGATFALAVMGLAETLGAPIAPAEALTAGPRVEVRGWRLDTPRLAALLVGGVLIAALTGAWLYGGVRLSDEVAVVAHRGAAGKAPENTLAAVHQAIEDGADWVEIDVQESADGEVIVIHDSDFMKLAGVDLKVWDATLDRIRQIDVGSWFDPRFGGERVPTLREVLEAARGKARVVIELKYYGHDQRLEQRVVEVVEAADMAPEIAIMSLKYEGIERVRALRPAWATGLLSAAAIGDLTRLDTDFLAVNLDMATPGFVRRARAAGKPVFVWTVNDPVSMSRVISIGVDGIITDEPRMAREVLTQRAEMRVVERLLVHTAVLFGHPIPPRAYRDASP
jgi:glycerophosphoryl diester phosphodiesterase